MEHVVSVLTQRKVRLLVVLVTLLLIGFILFYLPVPYYIAEPGSVVELQSVINVEDGLAKEDGTFMLVTVSMSKGNPALLLYSFVNPYAEVIPFSRFLGNDESPQEYYERQLFVMHYSQDNAVLAAYEQAGKQYDVSAKAKNDGVLILRIVQGMPAEKVLKAGDIIVKVDGNPVGTVEQLLDWLKHKQPQDHVKLHILREGKQQQVEVALKTLPPVHDSQERENRVGLGIYPVTNRVVKTSPKVRIDTHDIGGPSAGLMMALEIYQQLSQQNLSKGYRIAGTGTIDPAGKVGQIGSASQKVVAADARDADIFFVPKDTRPQDDNEAVAKKTARTIGTHMDVVPVATLADAIDYLRQLPLVSEVDK